MLRVDKSITDVIDGKAWGSSRVCKDSSCFGCVVRDAWRYDWLERFWGKDFCLPVNGGRYLLVGRDRSDRTGHNNFDIQEGRSPGFIVMIPGSEAIVLLVCLVLHTYVHFQCLRWKDSPSHCVKKKKLFWCISSPSGMDTSSMANNAGWVPTDKVITLISSIRTRTLET